MRPYTAATIYASFVASLIAFVFAFEALDRTRRGYRLEGSSLLEAAATTGFYFIVVFVLIAKFPTWPTKGLLRVQSTFAISGLRTPTHRLCFILMCTGLATVAITSGVYYLNGHANLLGYWFAGFRWAPSPYKIWLWAGLIAAIVGLLGSFLHDAVVGPIVKWVRGERTHDREK
ncbi:hypothetical protein MW290_31430 [Aquincola tertiaricarbonis]|uniref:Uncharacterized protein n=1 Tax=Aquincola tertiaricarbonis TaxID=391953 RepID=A0ABY4SAN2_AQUTE|nr:hypothetical protein [Aquincola tertiaricarbonis]URI10048.1 hypothetical protein MW290_31430 [Aquincola tertiaricarbonis]